MELRVPSGGAGDGLADGAHQLADDDATIIPDATPEQVNQMLTLLFDGSIEYVGLQDDTAWIQTAEAPGGYVVERKLAGSAIVAHPDPLTAPWIASVFQTFLAGNVDGGLTWAEAPPEPKKKGWFRR
jgi:hypothetical protein